MTLVEGGSVSVTTTSMSGEDGVSSATGEPSTSTVCSLTVLHSKLRINRKALNQV